MTEEVVCEECGQEYTEKSNPWYECSGCGVYHCPDCLKEHMPVEENSIQRKQAKKEAELENLAEKGDIETYKERLCPECHMEMNKMV
ncbi:MAG: hypothetical protein ACOC2J_04200 [bacterium]